MRGVRPLTAFRNPPAWFTASTSLALSSDHADVWIPIADKHRALCFFLFVGVSLDSFLQSGEQPTVKLRRTEIAKIAHVLVWRP